MALFKILSNMIDNNPPDPFGYIEGEEDDALVEVRSRAIGLPNTFNQGYCYFDRSTGKFWIDTTPTDNGAVTLLDKNEKTNNYVQGRIPINAYYADLAKLATSANYDGTGENEITAHYMSGLDYENNNGSLYLYPLDGYGHDMRKEGELGIQLGTHITIKTWTQT